jgi:hypothetical protein
MANHERLLGVLALLLVLFASGPAWSDYNRSQFLNAGQQNSVNSAMARHNARRFPNTDAHKKKAPSGEQSQAEGSQAQTGTAEPQTTVAPPEQGCGNLNVGNIVTPQGGRSPREVNIVVTGDITNVNNGLGSANCR